jgi:hypothetical protein
MYILYVYVFIYVYIDVSYMCPVAALLQLCCLLCCLLCCSSVAALLGMQLRIEKKLLLAKNIASLSR